MRTFVRQRTELTVPIDGWGFDDPRVVVEMVQAIDEHEALDPALPVRTLASFTGTTFEAVAAEAGLWVFDEFKAMMPLDFGAIVEITVPECFEMIPDGE